MSHRTYPLPNMGTFPGLGPVSEQMAFLAQGPACKELTVKRMPELHPGETNPHRE